MRRRYYAVMRYQGGYYNCDVIIKTSLFGKVSYQKIKELCAEAQAIVGSECVLVFMTRITA